MTVVICGRTNLSDRAEAITRHLREEQGFRTDGGCGWGWDLDHPMQHMQVVRCAECLRWLCRVGCIVAHFAESDHDSMPSVPEPTGGPAVERSAHSDLGQAPVTKEDGNVTGRESLPGTSAVAWRAGTDVKGSILSVGMPGSMGIGSTGTRPRATSNERRKAPQV